MNHNSHNNNNNNHKSKRSGGETTTTTTTTSTVSSSSGVPYGYLPAFLPGSASLVEQLDQKLMIVLRDGRHLIGTLRSFDQFSNMVLENTSERRLLQTSSGKCYYTDILLGLYLVRGDSMVLLGEVDTDDDDDDNDNDNQNNNEQQSKNDKAIKVSLDEFEKLESEHEKSVENLTWDFDLDLIV